MLSLEIPGIGAVVSTIMFNCIIVPQIGVVSVQEGNACVRITGYPDDAIMVKLIDVCYHYCY